MRGPRAVSAADAATTQGAAAMLTAPRLQAMLGTANAPAAKVFYQDVLGFKLKAEDTFSLTFNVGEQVLRLNKVPAVAPSAYAVLALHVDDIAANVRAIVAKGVIMERFAFLPPDADGIWSAPDGTKVAWFRDADANLLSLVQEP
jgi:catechol 2,3-dioxygenase-like lactoylglutathione lyase family enzyme